MRVWVTRARPGAEATAARLAALGHEPLVDPVLQVRDLPAVLDLRPGEALAFTSANGVRAFAVLSPARDRRAYAVGEATAEACRAAGFADVRAAGGDVQALAALILSDRPAAVLHAAPAQPAGDLVGDLAAAGLPARAVALYETVPRRPAGALEALGAGSVDAMLVHSARAAAVIAGLGLPPAARPPAFGLARAAVAPLLEAGWEEVRWADQPEDAALLGLLPPA